MPQIVSLPRRALRGLGWIAAIGAILAAIGWWVSAPSTPDDFYTPPASPPAAHGILLQAKPYTQGVPAGARAWRILYTTTRADDRPAIASAIVMLSKTAPIGPRPTLAWAHGTTGIVPGCAPAVMRQPFANVPAVDRILAAGMVYVATDYVGLGTPGGHAYLVGDEAARGVLDAVRAARGVNGVLLDGRIVVWGHSQGGNSALWAGIRTGSYAPDLSLIGVAAFAPASDLKALFQTNRGSMFGKIVSSYLLPAYAAAYPDVDANGYANAWTRTLSRDIAGRCVGGWGTLFSAAEAALLPSQGIFAGEPANGALGARLAGNTPTAPIPAPVLIGQGLDDDLVLPAVQARYVKERCASGQAIDYRTYAARDHVSLVADDSPLAADAMRWTLDRIAGKPAAKGCPISPLH